MDRCRCRYRCRCGCRFKWRCRYGYSCQYRCRCKRSVQFSSVQSLSHAYLCDLMDCSTSASLSITKSRSLLKLMSIVSVMSSNHLILCHPLLLPPSIFHSSRVFSTESVLIRWPKYWSFSFNISPSNKYSGLISFRIAWFDLVAVQGDPQESSITPHFKSISSLALSLYGPTLISIHDYSKGHSFDLTDNCWQSNVSAF